MMDRASPPQVELILALPDRCHRVSLPWQAGETAASLVARSGLEAICRQTTGAMPAALGVYGRRIDGRYIARPGDRIELLRALEIEPRAARQARVQRARENQA